MATETAAEKLDALYEFDREPVSEDRLLGAGYFWGAFAGEHVAATEFVIGALFVSWGATVTDIFAGLAIGNLLAVLTWTLLCAPVAVETRLTLYWYLRRIGGPVMTLLYNLINAALFCVLAGCMITVSPSAVRIPFGIPAQVNWYPEDWRFVLVVLGVGAVVVALATLGFKSVASFSSVCAPWMFLMFIGGAVAMTPVLMQAAGTDSFLEMCGRMVWTGRTPDGSAPMGFWKVAAFAWICNLAMHGGLSDMALFRFAKKKSYGLASVAGMFLGHYLAWICAGLMGAGAAFVVALLYGPESWRTFRGREIGVGRETIYGYTLPAHTYFTGLRTLLEHNQDGHETFLMGERSMTGWWYYFPVVIAVKSTLAFLVMAGLMALAGLRRVANIWRDPGGSFLWLALLTPAVVYLGVSMNSRINLGVRHLLPLYPLLYLLGAAALRRVVSPRRFALAAGLLVLLQSGETLAAYPEYLGFFNAAAGGRAAGPRYLLDSNVDWGQDLKKLMAYQKQTKPERMCVRYFGPMEPDALGMEYSFLPRGRDRREMEEMDCIGAISVTLLHDLYMDKGDYEWLRKRKPFGMVGTSIYLYDLRKR